MKKKVLHLPSCKYLQTAEIFTLLAIYPQRPTYTARLFLKIVRAMCQEMYKKNIMIMLRQSTCKSTTI